MITKEERIKWFRDSLKATTQRVYEQAEEIIQGNECSIDIFITLEPGGLPEIRISKDYLIAPVYIKGDEE